MNFLRLIYYLLVINFKDFLDNRLSARTRHYIYGDDIQSRR